jgi:hypothetical protein
LLRIIHLHLPDHPLVPRPTPASNAGPTRRTKVLVVPSEYPAAAASSSGGSVDTTAHTPISAASASRPWPPSGAGASYESSGAAPTASPRSSMPPSSFNRPRREVGRGSLSRHAAPPAAHSPSTAPPAAPAGAAAQERAPSSPIGTRIRELRRSPIVPLLGTLEVSGIRAAG